MCEPISFVVEAEDDVRRFDRLLAARYASLYQAALVSGTPLPTASRSVLQRWLSEGRVSIDGVPANTKTRARVGQRIVIAPAPPPTSKATPENIPLDIMYEDEDLIVVNKAAGMVVHPAPGHPNGTLVNALLFRGALAGDDPTRPGIVHRLDKDTSGPLVVAKTERAKQALVAKFQAHDIERVYWALCAGLHPETHTYRSLHGRHPHHRKRFSGQVKRGKEAITHVRRLSGTAEASLIACTLETGRTHQIRVHLSEAGHGLLGDPLYPGSGHMKKRASALGMPGQALHAAVLGFEHPFTKKHIRLTAAPPHAFETLAKQLSIWVAPE